MSFFAGAVVGSLDWDIGSFEKGFLRVEALTQTFPSIITNFMAHPMIGLVGVAMSAMDGVAAAVRGLASIFYDSLSHADRLGDLAANAGVSVEALSGLGLAAEQAGSSTEAMADAFKFLGKNVAEAMQGSKEQMQLFRDLGIVLTDAGRKARPLQDIMFDLSDALAGTEDAGRRTQIAIDLLGRSGTDLLSMLRQGSASLKEQIGVYHQYGAVVTEEAARSADAFGDVLGEFKIAWAGIKAALAEPLRDSLLPVLQNLLGWLRSHQPEIKKFLDELAKNVADAVARITKQITNLKKELVDIAIGSVLGAVAGGIAGGAIAGPAGVLPGMGIGYKLGGAGVAVTSHFLKPTVVVKSEMSDSQVGRMIREVIEEIDVANRAAIERDEQEQWIRARDVMGIDHFLR